MSTKWDSAARRLQLRITRKSKTEKTTTATPLKAMPAIAAAGRLLECAVPRAAPLGLCPEEDCEAPLGLLCRELGNPDGADVGVLCVEVAEVSLVVALVVLDPLVVLDVVGSCGRYLSKTVSLLLCARAFR